MLPLQFHAISPSDVCSLVSREVRESRRLDFKRDLYPLTGDNKDKRADAKRELIADVVAFANSEGGDIVIGIEEHDEVAVAHAGVPKQAAIDFELKLPDFWRTAVEPALTSVDSRVIDHPTDPEKAFVVIRIRPSPNAPHRTSAERHFYERTGAQKSRMDMPRIREAFVQEEIHLEAFDAFRRERLERAVTFQEHGQPLVLIHIVPLHALVRRSRQFLDFEALSPATQMFVSGMGPGYYTASGYHAERSPNQQTGAAAIRVFTDGRYEHHVSGSYESATHRLRLLPVLQALATSLSHSQKIADQLGGGPVLVGISAANLRGSLLDYGDAGFPSGPSKMEGFATVQCPEIRLEGLPATAVELASALAPSMRALWLAYNDVQGAAQQFKNLIEQSERSIR